MRVFSWDILVAEIELSCNRAGNFRIDAHEVNWAGYGIAGHCTPASPVWVGKEGHPFLEAFVVAKLLVQHRKVLVCV